MIDYGATPVTASAWLTLGLPRRDGTTNQTIAESRIRIYEKQTKDLLLA